MDGKLSDSEISTLITDTISCLGLESYDCDLRYSHGLISTIYDDIMVLIWHNGIVVL